MAINLIKGQRVEIESGLTRLKVEMGWKVNPNADPAYDLDASTFLLGSNGQIENEYDFVVYYFFLLSLHRNSTSGCGIRPSFH